MVTLRKILMVLCLICLGISPALLAAEVPTVVIAKDKVYMGDLITNASPEVARLYFGPAPRPGKSRLVTRRELANRLIRARMSNEGLNLPVQVRIKRLSQTIHEGRFASLVHKSLRQAVPAGVVVKDVQVSGGLLVGKGKVEVQINRKTAYRPGRQTVLAEVHVNGSKISQLPVRVRLEWPESSTQNEIVIERGDQVTVVVRKGGVSIKTRALAQEAGAIGHFIAVLPHRGHKMVRAQVLDGRTVEMRL